MRKHLLSGALLFLLGTLALPAQDREPPAVQKADAKGKTTPASWHLDFWPAWPKKTDFSVELCFAGATDALSTGFYLDERSISPKGLYGVIVPRAGVVRGGRNFLVDQGSRRVVGVLDGPGFAFPEKAEVGWSYHWAPDEAAVVIEQSEVVKGEWSRASWWLVELHDKAIVKQTDLLKNPGKVPKWLDAKAAPTHERSSPASTAAPTVLAVSSLDVGAWSVQRDAMGGPLHMVKDGKRADTLPPQRAIGADATGAVRELSSDEMPGLPICFFSPDEKWVFVNQIARANPETADQYRIGAIYWRDDSGDGGAATWKPPMSGNFNDLAWEAFLRKTQVRPESVAPPDASGFRDRTIEFINWSSKSGCALLYFHARNAAAKTKDGKPAYYRWYCYFDTNALAFDVGMVLDSANDYLRGTWNSSSKTVDPRAVPLRVGEPGLMSLYAPVSDIMGLADSSLNSAYQALLQRVPKSEVEKHRQEQRAWLAYRETLAWAHVFQRWSRFTDVLLDEGRYLATHLRAEDLEAEAQAAAKGPNTLVREKSPDGKYGMLYTFHEDDLDRTGTPEGVELVELPSKKVVLDLYDETTNRDMHTSWSPDSSRFAFHSGTHRMLGFILYQRKGDSFETVDGPDLDRFEPVKKKDERGYHFNYSDLKLKRWLGANKVLAHYGIAEDVEDSKGHQRLASADFDLVLSMEKGKLVIEKVTKTKSDK